MGGGAALVFGTRKVSRKVLEAMLAFAAGAMIFVLAEQLIPKPGAAARTPPASQS